MCDGLASPFASPVEPSLFNWFAHRGKIFLHPSLTDEEKLLWLWLATQCINEFSFSCSISYEQISLAVNKPAQIIHFSLLRLVITGFLIGDIPNFYYALTPEMVQEVRTLKLQMPSVIPIVRKKDGPLQPSEHLENNTSNLIDNKDEQKETTQTKPLSFFQKVRRFIMC